MKKSGKVAVTSRSFSKHPVLRAELKALYDHVSFNETGKVLAGADLLALLKGHDKAIVGLEVIDASLLAQLPELKIIGKHGVGLDKLDFDALERHGVRLGWTGGVNRRSVAELALGFMLTLLRQVHITSRELRSGVWEPRVGNQLTEKTVGIIGCGFIGKDLVEMLKPFRCKVLAHDICDYSNFYGMHGVKAVSLEELLRQSDIVTLHIPYDSSTKNIISRDRLALMKPTALLINTARGGLVDEAALKDALVDRKIAGAGFDVFSVEPPPNQDLTGLPNFLATPHIGGSAEEALVAMGRAAIRGLEEAVSMQEFRKLLKGGA